jgi:hypothetical protein
MDVKRERFEGNAASGQGETRADPREVGALVTATNELTIDTTKEQLT